MTDISQDHDHDHDHDHDEEDLEGEISISFAPRFEDLSQRGITPEQFEAALLTGLEEFETLSARDDLSTEDLTLENLVLHINGNEYRLADLADIEISEEIEEEYSDEYDDDEEFDDEEEEDA